MCVRGNRRRFLKQTLVATAALSVPMVMRSRRLLAQEKSAAGKWTSFRNSPQNLGIADSVLPATPTRLWDVATSDGTASTAVIADGRVYIGTLGGDLLCLQLIDGKEIWKYRSVEVVEQNSFAPGFNAAAAMDERRIYIGDDQGVFHAVDRQTGLKAWQAVTDGEIVGGAQLYQGQVIFGSHDGHLYGHQAETGERLWSVETRGPVNATPCLAGKYTFTTGCDQPVLRVVDVEKGVQAAEVPLKSLLIAAAAVRDDILYFGTDNGTVTALDWQKKTVVWEFSAPNRDQQIQSSPAVSDEVVVIGSRDKRVYCLDRKTGEQRWAFVCRAKIDSSPVIAGDMVYFGSSDKNVYGVKLSDGSEACKFYVKHAVTGSPAIAEGRLVIGCESSNGPIVCFG